MDEVVYKLIDMTIWWGRVK